MTTTYCACGHAADAHDEDTEPACVGCADRGLECSGFRASADDLCRCAHHEPMHGADGACLSPTTDEGGWTYPTPCACEAYRDLSGAEGPTYDARFP